MTIRSITMTGVNADTDLNRLVAITQAASGIGIEWGVLYSPERAGLETRYPSVEWIQSFRRIAFENKLRIALHACGKGVDEMLLENKQALKLIEGYSRIQLNFDYEKRQYNLAYIDRFIAYAGRPVITQHNDQNAYVSSNLTSRNHQLLVDASRGKGISPGSWPAPIALKPTGYAGGLGPHNLAETLDTLEQVTGVEGFKSWVDMESKLFTPEGKFDLSRAEAAIHIMEAHSQRRIHEAQSGYSELSL